MQQPERPQYPFNQSRRSPWAVRAIWLGGLLMVGSFALVSTRGLDTKESFVGAAMKGDLRALVVVQDDLFHDSNKYFTRVPTSLFVPTSGHTGPVITVTTDGWTAEMHNGYSPQVCAVFVGSAPLAPATVQREPHCTPLAYQSSLSAGSIIGLVALVVGPGLALVGSAVAIRRSLTPSAA